MSNNLADLNNHLFTQLGRLADTEMTGDDLKQEIERSKAITAVGRQVIDNASLVLEAKKLNLEYGGRVDLPALLGNDSA